MTWPNLGGEVSFKLSNWTLGKRMPRTQLWPLATVIDHVTVSSLRLYRRASTTQDCANAAGPLSSHRTKTVRSAFRRIRRATDKVEKPRLAYCHRSTVDSIVCQSPPERDGRSLVASPWWRLGR